MLTPALLERVRAADAAGHAQFHVSLIVRPPPEASAADAVELVEEVARRAANAVRRARGSIPAPLALVEVAAPEAAEVPVQPLALGGTVLWDATDYYEMMERVQKALGPGPRLVDADGETWVWTLWITWHPVPEEDRPVAEIWALEGA